MVVLVIVTLLTALIAPVVAIVLLLDGNTILYGLLAYAGIVVAVVFAVLKVFSGTGKDVLIPTGATLGGRGSSAYQAHGNPQS